MDIACRTLDIGRVKPILLLTTFLFALTSIAEEKLHSATKPEPRSGGWTKRHESFNKRVAQGNCDLIFIGDSITEFWSAGDPALFGPGIVNRGISGQTSSQMLVRFWPDVVALNPGAVHIMAGTNDLAENTGHVSDETYQNNIRAMVTLAQANGISVILASIPPAGSFGWRPELKPDVRIAALNEWLEAYADETGAVFVDYHSLLSADGSAMSPDLTHDGVHPHSLGYAAMNEAATKAIDAALAEAD